MSRAQLAEVATKFIGWTNTKPLDQETLSTIVSKDVVVPIPYPGATPNYDGLFALASAAHAAAEGFNMTIKNMVVDEEASTVVLLINIKGKHVGEWLGIPATGKSFDTLEFVMMKIDPASGLIVEHSEIHQDLSLLQQIGVLPTPPTS